MSAAPGARDEYSRGNAASRGGFGAGSGPAWRGARRLSKPMAPGASMLILIGALVGAALLVAAEFTTLYQAHLASKATPFDSVTAGSHNSYAMIPIALLAAAFGIVVRRTGSRLVLVGIGILGLVALLLALLHDLPDAHAVGLAQHNSISATTTPGVGLYLETLGAILLIATSGIGLVLAGIPRRRRSGRPHDRSRDVRPA